MTSIFAWLFKLICEYRGLIILVLILLISKTQKIIHMFISLVNMCFKLRKLFSTKVQKVVKAVKLKGEDKKIFVLTKCNTLVNRDLLDKRNDYLKKVKKEYNQIYGQKGAKYFESIQKDIQKPKKNKKVSFSGEVQYSN